MDVQANEWAWARFLWVYLLENFISNNFCSNTFFSKMYPSSENRKKPIWGH